MPYDHSPIDEIKNEKLLAEFQWRFSSDLKEAFALTRDFGRYAVAQDVDPDIVIWAATLFIEIFSVHLPPPERLEELTRINRYLLEACERLVDDNNDNKSD